MQPAADVLAALINGAATIAAAVIVGVFGALIGAWYSRKRDDQDRESQWRSHAIELTKLDLERKLKTRAADDKQPIRPSILDFLANYRDLQELGKFSPKELYLKIKSSRITNTANTVDDRTVASPGPATNQGDA